MRVWLRLGLVVTVLCARATIASAQTYLLVVSGIGGEEKYRIAFQEWSSTLVSAAEQLHGLPVEHITYLAESESLPGVTARSTKAGIEAALMRFADVAETDARVFVVLIGHGSAVGGESRFQIPGPDMTAPDFAALLSLFPSQQIVFVNLSSASGGFIPVLSGERRTIITATKSGHERNETVFPGYFVRALAGEGADVDKDERVSLLEAFDFARLEVARDYERDNRIQTEHALLDDNGDGRGSVQPGTDGADGSVAARLFLRDPSSAAASASDPELNALLVRRQQLEEELTVLRARKDSLASDIYQRELERVLLEIARTGRAIREREGGRP